MIIPLLAATFTLQMAPMSKAPIAKVTVKDVAGASVTLPGLGRGTVMFFVATDCPIANRYAPEMARIVRTFQGKGIGFVYIYVDPSHSSAQVRSHLKEYRLGAPGVLDVRHRIVKAVGATVTPQAVLLDRNGVMRYRGRIDDLFLEHGRANAVAKYQDLRNALNQFVSGKPIKVPQTPALGCTIPPLD